MPSWLIITGFVVLVFALIIAGLMVCELYGELMEADTKIHELNEENSTMRAVTRADDTNLMESSARQLTSYILSRDTDTDPDTLRFLAGNLDDKLGNVSRDDQSYMTGLKAAVTPPHGINVLSLDRPRDDEDGPFPPGA